MERSEKKAKRINTFVWEGKGSTHEITACGCRGCTVGITPNAVALSGDNSVLAISAFNYSDSLNLVDYISMQSIIYLKTRKHFVTPSGLAFHPFTDNLLVCDMFGNRINLMDKTKVIGTIGEPLPDGKSDARPLKGGSENGKFNVPIAATFGPDGGIFVAEMEGERVQIFDPCFRFLRKFSLGEGQVRTFGLALLDRRFCASYGGSSVLISSDLNGNELGAWSTDSNQHVASIQIEGNRSRGVCTDLKGYVYVSTEGSKIQVFDPRKNMARITSIYGTSPQFHTPTGLAIDNTNRLIVANTGHSTIQVIDLY